MIEGVTMKTRMERYEKQPTSNKEVALRREDRNQELYHDFYSNSTYTEFQEYNNNVVDLSNLNKQNQTREEYQKIKEFQDLMPPLKEKRDLDRFETLYPTDDNKVYDINSILEEAKKNREEIDELERKRKLRSTQYNILANLDLDQLKREQKTKKEEKSEEEEIQELIDTITSRNLRKQIDEADKDLMSDLLPSSSSDTIVTEPSSELEQEEEEEENQPKEATDEIDRSFYTRSMDLSDEDFEEESDEMMKDAPKRIPTAIKVILFLILIAVMTTIIYFFIQNL